MVCTLTSYDKLSFTDICVVNITGIQFKVETLLFILNVFGVSSKTYSIVLIIKE